MLKLYSEVILSHRFYSLQITPLNTPSQLFSVSTIVTSSFHLYMISQQQHIQSMLAHK